MESTLSSLATWFHAHGLKLNTSKTELLVLGTRQNTRSLPPVSVRVGGETVHESHVVRNLGVLFDRHLDWDAHVTSVVNKCIGLLIGLRHLRRYLLANVMLTIVRSLIISRVNYCISVYSHGTAQNERKLMKVVNFAARVVTGLRKFDRVSSVLTRMCDVRTMLVAHSAQFSTKPTELASLFETSAAARAGDRVTRSDHQLRTPAMRTATGQRAFAFRAAKLLNALDTEMKRLDPIGFKRALRSLAE